MPLIAQGGENKFQITLLRNFEEIKGIRETWIKFQYYPNTDYDFFQTIIKNRPEVCYPLIMVFKKESDITSIVVCRVEKRTIPCKIGYSKLFSSKFKSLNILYGGFLGDRNEEIVRLVFNQIDILIKNKEIEVAELSFMDVSGMFFSHYLRVTSAFFRELLLKPQPHYFMELPDSEENLFKEMSAHHRNTILRKARKMEKIYGEKLVLKAFHFSTDIIALCLDAEVVAAKSYQRKLGVGFFNTDETRARLQLWAEKEMLFGYILYIEGQPIAFWIGTAYMDIFVSDYIAFDPNFSNLSPGIVCIVNLMRNLISSNKNIKKIDFNFGEAPYKKEFGTQCIVETSALIYAPQIRFLMIRLIRLVIGSFNVFILTIIRKSNLELKIKKLIRSA
jgi:hypothetical protein